ncbi:hypothetical protein AB835_11860 [Candidatus Endobugula sertula]|uniref:Major facilitator superfamily (MFS) profile domain-containing protein n=1 Tax=Candidatus Endobugula sertula TaxID=62101 RepID=A0A1D2QMP2_9GAMM|nr:hypothetical protein AB835_11860 [Candidatus Endobugula sertula]
MLSAQVIVLPLDITMMGILSPMVMDDLVMKNSEFILASNVYNILFAGFFIASGVIVSRIGYRYALVISAVLFALASVLCALSMSSTHLIIFRAMQGLAASMVLISCLAFIRTEFPGRKVMLPMAMFSIYIAIGNVVGPLVTTLLAEIASWRWVFYINIPITLLATVAVSFLSSNKPVKSGTQNETFLPWFLFGIVLSLIVLLISYSETASYIVYGLCLVAIFLVYTAVLDTYSAWSNNAWVKSCRTCFGRFSVTGFLYEVGYWAMLFYMPIIGRVVFQFDDLQTAIFCLIIAIPLVSSQVLSIPIIKCKNRKFLYQLSATGAALSALTSAYLFSLDNDLLLLMTIAMLGFFVSLVNSDVTASALMSVKQEQSGFYAGLNTAVRYSGFGIGTLFHQHIQLNTFKSSAEKYTCSE